MIYPEIYTMMVGMEGKTDHLNVLLQNIEHKCNYSLGNLEDRRVEEPEDDLANISAQTNSQCSAHADCRLHTLMQFIGFYPDSFKQLDHL